MMGVDFDEDAFRNTIADKVEEIAVQYVEEEAGNGDIECDCGSQSFDVETWETSDGYEGAAVCRECNERQSITFDMSDIDVVR